MPLLMFTWCYHDSHVCTVTKQLILAAQSEIFFKFTQFLTESLLQLGVICSIYLTVQNTWGGYLKLWRIIIQSFSLSDSMLMTKQRRRCWCISLEKKAKPSWNLKIFTSELKPKKASVCNVINLDVPEIIIILQCNRAINHFHTTVNLQ